MKILMNAAGYDTLQALSEINEEKIKEIEFFLTSNIQLVKKLTCCRSDYYTQLQTFQFLPGHRAMIMALPDQIKQMKNEKTKKKHENELENRPTRGPKNTNHESDDDLKMHLINNLVEYLRKIGLQFPEGVIDETNIDEFQRQRGADDDDIICECRFSCPFCSKFYNVKHKKYWLSSNITTHLKKHLESGEYLVVDAERDDNVCHDVCEYDA